VPGANTEVERIGIAALTVRDIAAMSEMLAPEAEVHPALAGVTGTVYRGHDGVRRW